MTPFCPCPLGAAESTEDDCLGVENVTTRVARRTGPRDYVMTPACPECARRFENREPSEAQLERKAGA